MQQIDKTLAVAQKAIYSQIDTGPQFSAGSHEKIVGNELDMVFGSLQVIFPNRRADLNIDEYKRELMLAMIDCGLDNRDAIDDWLDICRGRASRGETWLISPHTICGWSRPTLEQFGLLPPRRAYLSACRSLTYRQHAGFGHWHDPVVYAAALETTFFRLRTTEERFVYKDFEAAYLKLSRRFMAGEVIRFPADKNIEKNTSRKLSKAENIQNMEKLRALVGF